MFKKITLSFIFLVVSLGLALLITMQLGKSELRQQRQAYLDGGGILDVTQFLGSGVADDQNAALAYQPVFDFLITLTDDEENLLRDPALADEPALRALLNRCGPTLAALRLATELPECDWEAERGMRGIDPYFSAPLSWLRDAAIILQADAQVLARGAQTNENDEAILRDIEALLRLGQHSRTDSTILGLLTGGAFCRMGVDLYEEVFRDHAAPPNEIAEILKGFDQGTSFRRALQGEVFMAEEIYAEIAAGEAGFEFDLPKWTLLFVHWDRAYYFRMMTTALLNAGEPFYEAQPMPEPPWYVFTGGFLVPPLELTALGLAKLQLRIEMLNIAETLRAYKAEHESYPAVDADEITMPIDPVTGELIQYERVDEGFILTGLIGVADEDEVQWVWEN